MNKIKSIVTRIIQAMHFEIILRVYRTLKYEGWYGLRKAILRKLCREQPGLWKRYSEEANTLVSWLDFSSEDIILSKKIQEDNDGEIKINSITWFIPDFFNPFFGGIHTILRFANYLTEHHKINHCFVIVGNMDEKLCMELIESAFPGLRGSSIRRMTSLNHLDALPETDIGIATLWTTAYFLLKWNRVSRKFYFVQDYEPLFYPAGSTFAQVDATYRFGFFGIANTPTIENILTDIYGGVAEYFFPSVDTSIFYPKRVKTDSRSRPYQVFFYGRPEHPRNGFELGVSAFRYLKMQLGDKVRIVSAGAAWNPVNYGLDGIVENLGVLSYQETAELYKNCDVGLVMMFTRHPSYLPFELMACGCLVVTNYNPATLWMVKHEENCLLSETSASCIAATLKRGLLDSELREQIVENALTYIKENYSCWDKEIVKIYEFMKNPYLEKQSPAGRVNDL